MNSVIYDIYGHALHLSASAESGFPGSVRDVMFGDVGTTPAWEQPPVLTVGKVWPADPDLGANGVPAADSPAVGKADPRYLWPYDMRGKPRIHRTLGAFEPG